MSDAIYRNDRWQIERDPYRPAHQNLVRFVRRGPSGRKMLDQIAQWTDTGWDQSRWVPRPPMVSQGILDLVERHMRRLQP